MTRNDNKPKRDKFLTDSEEEEDENRITNKNQFIKVAKVGTGTYGYSSLIPFIFSNSFQLAVFIRYT